MTLELANQNICKLCDWIEEMQALSTVIHPYFMDAADLDVAGAFV